MKIWFLTFLCLNGMDFGLTNLFLTITEVPEGNAVARMLHQNMGMMGLFLLKVASVLVVYLCVRTLVTKDRLPLAKKTLFAGIGLQTLAIVLSVATLLIGA